MKLNYEKILQEIDTYENDNKTEEYRQLMHCCHETYIELEIHKDKEIKIDNNDMSSDVYILRDFNFYKMEEQLDGLKSSVTLILTLEDVNGNEFSAGFYYIEDIEINLNETKIMVFHVKTSNRCLDHDYCLINKGISSYSKDIQEYVREHFYKIRKIYLYK